MQKAPLFYINKKQASILYFGVINMYAFDAHCDWLYKRLEGEKTEEKDKRKYKCISAVFEGAPAREKVGKQLALLKEEETLKSAYIAFEGLSWIRDEQDIRLIKKHNTVYASPTWNRANFLGGSCYDDAPLTCLGKEVLKQLEEAKIYIDTAHSGRKMFFSIADDFENVICSHANVYSIKPHARNLTDKQIKVLIEKNTFFGLSFYTEFVGGDRVEDLFNHIEYVLDLGGENILGFGSDIDGCDSLVEPGGVRVFDAIYEKMLAKNYSVKLIEKIFYGNLERIIKKMA